MFHSIDMKKTISLLILILFSVIPAYPSPITGKEAQDALDEVGISLNKNAIPDDPRGPMNPSGIRIGVPAVTTRGMKEKEIKIIAKWINDVCENHKNKKVLNKIHREVIALCRKFPLYREH